MKRNIFVLGLMLASFLVGFSGIRTHGQSNQNDAKQTNSSKRVYDIDGKRLQPDEKYIAERTLKNGRIIGYRKNKREIAALVKALEQDGVGDKRLLDPQTWLMNICEKTANDDPPCQGGCGWHHTCKGFMNAIDRRAHPISVIHYCYCIQ